MTLKTDFEAAAVEIFNTFESLIKNATYIEQNSTYAAGGNLSLTENQYSIRLIQDSNDSTLMLATDVRKDAIKYLMITAELPVKPKVKDQILLGTERKSIVSVETDPGDIIQIIWVGK
jgi:hypothetical protein